MWKPVIYKGILTVLLVNEKGLVYNTKKKSMAHQWCNTNGYMSVYIPKIRKAYRVHRIVAEAFIPNPNNLPQVNHIDGVKTNNRVENLEWCNASMNAIHAFKHGLVQHARGENAGASKYIDSQIHEVCRLLEQNIPCTEISKRTGVGRKMVNSIKLRQNWVHISKDYKFDSLPRKTYPEINFIVDRLIEQGYSRRDIINGLIDKGLVDSMKLAKYIYDRRLKTYKKRCCK